MPKVTITFQVPEEQDEYTTCINANKYYGALWDIYTLLRNRRKYCTEVTEQETEMLEWMWEEFYKILDTHGIGGEF